jgi:hypothetical protein
MNRKVEEGKMKREKRRGGKEEYPSSFFNLFDFFDFAVNLPRVMIMVKELV